MTTTTHTIVGLYNHRSDAENAVEDLVREGFSRDRISVVAPDSPAAPSGGEPHIGPVDTIGSDTKTGAGAAVGGLAGFLVGIAALAIPGVGPVIAAGPLAAGILGAGLGAAGGWNRRSSHTPRYSRALCRPVFRRCGKGRVPSGRPRG